MTRGLRVGLVPASSSGLREQGAQSWFDANLVEETTHILLLISFSGRIQVVVLMVFMVSFGKSQTSQRGGWRNGVTWPLDWG